jgi:hypothetical protein
VKLWNAVSTRMGAWRERLGQASAQFSRCATTVCARCREFHAASIGTSTTNRDGAQRTVRQYVLQYFLSPRFP